MRRRKQFRSIVQAAAVAYPSHHLFVRLQQGANMTTRRRPPATTRMNHDRFPPIFAITTDRNRDRNRSHTGHHHDMSVWVFTTERLQYHRHPYYYAGGGSSSNTYAVAPHRFRTEQYGRSPPAFYVQHDIPNHAYHWDPVTLVYDRRRAAQQPEHSLTTRWRFTGTMIYSMSHSEPIPLLDLERAEELLQAMADSDNELRVYEGGRDAQRMWERRWAFTDIEEEIAEEEEADRRRERRARRAAAAAAAAAVQVQIQVQPPPVQPPPTQALAPSGPRRQAPTPIPKFVADLIIADAIAKSSVCPITMEPVTAATAAATSCFHVFDANAIAIWLTNDNKCPTCKTRCTA